MKSRIHIVRTIACTLILGAAGVAGAATPTEQKAIVQTGNGGPEVLKLQTIPVLEPGEGQVLIRVYAADINPADWKIRQGMMGPRPGGGPPGAGGTPPGGPPPGGPPPGGSPTGGPPTGGPPAGGPPPAGRAGGARVGGLDVAGVVEKLGPGVTALKVGEPVFSTIGRGGPAGLNGGYSEFVVAPADNVVAKPKKLTYAEAAGLGTVGATAARVINQAKVAKGQRVLVTGVAGGVGSSAAQIATALGAYVLGTASPRHNAYLKTIGVNEVIDYTQGNWADKARNVDVVIDTVGGDTALTALGALRKGGTYVSVASRDITPDKCAAAGVNCAGGGPPGPAGPSEGDLLRQVAQLANEGKFKVNIDRTYPLANAADAQEYNRQGHTEGKVILIVDAAEADKK